ncbi:YgeY family selenium metabolism-linked hydrolase [Gottschalkiaceae bacterium SANA]|nr:YgeY family selenium metabolism-linked hydrolase [Gottschalkiaceae bacterium SANA]
MTSIQIECLAIEKDMIRFLQDLIKIESLTGAEQVMAARVKKEMISLGYDRVLETTLGDVIGVIGNGPVSILFDSHMDTVPVTDAKEWQYPPFEGVIADGRIHGRGTVDMKSAIASTVYAGYLAKKLGFHSGKTIYVSASVMEEDFDGYALGNLIDELELKLDYAVVCEPSQNRIAVGHRGRALFEVHTKGIACHGSAPENGENAVYEMNRIISRVEELNRKLYEKTGEHGSVALSKIESSSVSLNAVPDACTIYLDRRLAIDETYQVIQIEMDKLVEGLNAEWNVYIAKGKSSSGIEVSMNSFMEAWDTAETNNLPTAMAQAYLEQTDRTPEFFKWNFSTNGFASTARNITTIGYGPGEIKYCHMRDESCKISDIIEACQVYTGCLEKLS